MSDYTQPLVGYPGLVWLTCWQSMSWLTGVLQNSSASSQSITAGVEATFATIRNGSNAIAAYQTASVLSAEATNLTAVLDMGLSLDPLTQTYATARVNSTVAAASGISGILPALSPWAASGLLAAGSPAIPDPMFLEWCMGFDGESIPPGLAVSGIVACAAQETQSWLNVAQAVQIVEGVQYTDYRYDTAIRTWRTSSYFSNGSQNGVLNLLQSGPPNIANKQAWNSVAALPAILLSAASLMSAPYSLVLQQSSVTRYALNSISQLLAQLLLSLRNTGTSIPGVTTLSNGQSLQDLAAQTTGDAENWVSIAALNNLSPPYPGGNNSALASAGVQLLLPSAGSPPVTGGNTPNYFANVLGTDWDYGPINAPQPVWLGDIPLITGYQNFARALGRRLQTPLSSLIYHVGYGDRIPGEVGAIQSENEAPKLAQYGNAAINSDPRTGSILSFAASVQPGFLATYSAKVLPIGPGAKAVQINETIGSLP